MITFINSNAWAIYILVGIIAGLLSGILGIGGGVIIVPALVFLLARINGFPADAIMQIAVATSLAIMILTSSVSLYSHHRLNKVLWHNFHKLWPGLIVGTITGGILSNFFSSRFLECMLAIFLLLIAFKMIRNKTVTTVRKFPSPWFNFIVAAAIGTNSGLLGIGGGVLIVPYLHYCGVELKKITAISAACTLTIALSGTLVFIILGNAQTFHLANTLGTVYLPAVLYIGGASCLMAPIGARLAYILPVTYIRNCFIVILLISAFNLFY